MDEYLSEKEQVERIREWWREYGWYLVGGVLLGTLGLFGWNAYKDSQLRSAEQAAALYQSLQQAVGDDRARAVELLGQLRSEYPSSAYADQAGLLVARMHQVGSEPERAAEELRNVMQTADDPELAMIARLRLARVLAYREQYAEALQLLDVADPGQFAGRVSEIKGDIHYSLGEIEAARSAYLAALTEPGSELLDRNVLQMKLNDLQTQPGVSDATSPESGGAEGGAAPDASDGAADPSATERDGAGAGSAERGAEDGGEGA